MIESFLATWPLFHDVYEAGVLIAALLSLVGIAVVARDQIFLGAAVSQASMLGIAVGIWLGDATAAEWLSTDAMHSVVGGAFAVAGSLAIAAAAPRVRETLEGLTGWLFLVGAALSVLVVANSPHGMAEVQRLLASTIIGANAFDVALFAVLLLATIAVVALRPRSLVLVLTDPEMARASGLAAGRWEHAIAVWLGISVAWSIHVAGTIFTFGLLVLPAMIAKSLARRVRTLFVVAPAAAVAATAAAFVVANDYDLPPGQVAVALLCAMQLAAWAGRSLRPLR